MDVSSLPRHIVDRVEKQWAQKLQQQARNWQSTKSDDRYLTDRGVPGGPPPQATGEEDDGLNRKWTPTPGASEGTRLAAGRFGMT
jgi:hypothetical protein